MTKILIVAAFMVLPVASNLTAAPLLGQDTVAKSCGSGEVWDSTKQKCVKNPFDSGY